VKLASATTKTKSAEEVSIGLQEVQKEGEKNARDNIAHILNLQRKANFRIDKSMATHIRTYQVFRLDPELTGNISIFHCFPRQTQDLQDIISGEELETRVRTKAINGNVVKKYYEQKLGIAGDASSNRCSTGTW
jgi:hypothetical protein